MSPARALKSLLLSWWTCPAQSINQITSIEMSINQLISPPIDQAVNHQTSPKTATAVVLKNTKKSSTHYVVKGLHRYICVCPLSLISMSIPTLYFVYRHLGTSHLVEMNGQIVQRECRHGSTLVILCSQKVSAHIARVETPLR